MAAAISPATFRSFRPRQYWEVSWESKGKVVSPYGTRPETPSDGDLADLAFERLGEKTAPASHASQPEAPAPRALSDGEQADLAFKQLGK
jgi:hypothetical protein